MYLLVSIKLDFKSSAACTVALIGLSASAVLFILSIANDDLNVDRLVAPVPPRATGTTPTKFSASTLLANCAYATYWNWVVPIVIKLFPAAASISIFKNLGDSFQLMVVKFPIVLIAPVSPITAVNKPCAFVMTLLVSVYSNVPVALPCRILNLIVMACDDSITLLFVLATP